MSTQVTSRLPRKSAFSLAALLYLVTIVCVLLSIAVPAAAADHRNDLGTFSFWSSALVVGLLGAVLGGVIGLFRYRRWLGLSGGLISGFALGACVSPMLISTASVVVGLLGAVLGGVIGLFHYRRWHGLSCGLLTGFVVGACVGPVLNSQNYGQVVATCLGGSLLLVILASVYRLGEHTD